MLADFSTRLAGYELGHGPGRTRQLSFKNMQEFPAAEESNQFPFAQQVSGIARRSKTGLILNECFVNHIPDLREARISGINGLYR